MYISVPVLMYGCEVWTIRKEIDSRLKAIEVLFLHRMLRILYVNNNRDEGVLERVGTMMSLVKEVRKRQAVFFRHVMKRKELEHLVTIGKIDGKRSRADEKREEA